MNGSRGLESPRRGTFGGLNLNAKVSDSRTALSDANFGPVRSPKNGNGQKSTYI